MRPFVLLIAIFVAACPSSKVVKSAPGPHALTAAEREALGAPPVLFELLPDGPATKVELRRTKSGEPVGFWFDVRPEVASFTVHAMRRQLAEAVAEADGGIDPPVRVYEGGIDGDGSRAIVVRTARSEGEDDAVLLDAQLRAVDVGDLSQLLERWHQETGLSVLGASPDWVELELDRLPQDEDEFLSALAALTNAGTDDDGEAIHRSAAELRGELVSTHRVTLP